MEVAFLLGSAERLLGVCCRLRLDHYRPSPRGRINLLESEEEEEEKDGRILEEEREGTCKNKSERGYQVGDGPEIAQSLSYATCDLEPV